MSSCRAGRTPCVSPAVRSTGRRRAPPGAPVSRLWASVCSFVRNKWTQRSQFTGIPRNPSQMPTKVAACEIALGRSCEAPPVVVAQPAHEAARQRGAAALGMPDEANNVAVWRVGLPIRRRWNDPCRGRPLHVWRQLITIHELVQGELRHRRSIPWQRIQHHDWLGRSHCG
jgi:hypothetical protein